MQLSERDLKHITGDIVTLKSPAVGGAPAQRLPEVIETVSAMLGDIEKNGMDAVVKYSRQLDGWQGKSLEIGQRRTCEDRRCTVPGAARGTDGQCRTDPAIRC
jgi:sulfopropanediol 3-dehydrogenase